MGLSLSLLLSAWNEIISHKFFGFMGTREAVMVRSMSFEREDSVVSDNMNMERPMSFKNWKFTEPRTEESDHAVDENLGSTTSSKCRIHETLKIKKPSILLPEPEVMFSPRPVRELDAAATTLQKVYKSYRTRRNLADCAVLVEELWWQALDFAFLERSSVSFFKIEKQETPESRWARARTRAAKVGKGLCKDEKAQKLALQHWLEAIDPRHRYGHNLQFYHDVWSDSKSTQPFFYWLDVGDGKDINLEKCPRSTVLQRQCIKYLGPKEREAYEVIVENGKLVQRQTGMLVNTDEDSKWIFVLSTSRSLYVGQKKKGSFQHSSFLSGGATTAAGRLVAHNGVLEAIWPYSGHYLPTEDNFNEFISFLEEHQVDLTNVKMCATDDDTSSFKAANSTSSFKAANSESSKPNLKGSSKTTAINLDINAAIVGGPTSSGSISTDHHQNESFGSIATNAEGPVFDLSRRLSCKWTSGLGPRIGCVRDYPANLQLKALEQVNLSPRVTSGRHESCDPIPSPRPSPKIRVSPRLAYMGLPSPRVPQSTTS